MGDDRGHTICVVPNGFAALCGARLVTPSQLTVGVHTPALDTTIVLLVDYSNKKNWTAMTSRTFRNENNRSREDELTRITQLCRKPEETCLGIRSFPKSTTRSSSPISASRGSQCVLNHKSADR